MYIKEKYPEGFPKLSKQGLKELESDLKQGELVDEMVLEIFIGLSRFSTRLTEDYLELLEHLDLGELPPSIYEIATDFDMCHLSVLFPLVGELEIKEEKELKNLQALVGWAKKFALKYAS